MAGHAGSDYRQIWADTWGMRPLDVTAANTSRRVELVDADGHAGSDFFQIWTEKRGMRPLDVTAALTDAEGWCRGGARVEIDGEEGGRWFKDG
jgi:hypothetical protein